MEHMRINAEKERIKKYQDITKDSAYKYYKILKNLNDYLQKKQKEELNNPNSGQIYLNQDPQFKIK